MINKQQEVYFELLTANRMEAAKALEGFALRGVKNSVVEKYSDQAHFIYELLQNADDAKATSARFELFRDRLEFAHNGTRRFTVSHPITEAEDLRHGTLGDINAITAVGGSSKNDGASIGKFGVGFKAVFQYTSTPYIYDPNVFFKIQRFIVPVRIHDDYLSRKNGETMFVFPFDHGERKSKEAYTDISEKLYSLDYPLLFLSNLKNIEFEISGALGLYGKTIEEKRDFGGTTAELIRLTQNDGENREDLYDIMLWLFTRNNENGHRYSVGYFIDTKGRLVSKSHSAFCFFPTKEVTGLNFIIHAPFLLTDSREGIRAGVPHNQELISLLAALAADSLVYLRDIGISKNVHLIDDNIFDIVPYNESAFTDVASKKVISFKPFFTAMKETLKKERMIPAEKGYVEAENAYWAFVPLIAKLFSNEQLSDLVKNNKAQWVFTSFGRQDTLRRNKPLTDYIDSITRVWIDENAILKGWSNDEGVSYEGINAQFIEAQPFDWLHRFYHWLGETRGRAEVILTKPIFLNQQGKATAAFDKNKHAILFLPIEGASGYDTVHEVLLQNEDTVKFIKQIGIREPALRDEIFNIILRQYGSCSVVNNPYQDFKKFFRYYRTCSQIETKSFLIELKKYKFIIYTSEIDDGNQHFAKPEEVYFSTALLKEWFELKPETKYLCYDQYLELVGEDNKEELYSFFTDLGIQDMPRILERSLTEAEAYKIKPRSEWPQPAEHKMHTRAWTEYYIDGLQENIMNIVENNDKTASIVLWSHLIKFAEKGLLKDVRHDSRPNALCGTYEYFYYAQRNVPFESSDARYLRSSPWLLNVEGKFVSAEELTVQTLNPEYDLLSEKTSELFCILNIDEDVGDRADDHVDIARFAERLGYSKEDVKRLLEEDLKRRKASEDLENDFDDDDANTDAVEILTDPNDDDASRTIISRPSIRRVGNEITKRAVSTRKERYVETKDSEEEECRDEDCYSTPTIDIIKKIEKVKAQAENDIQEIARLEDLKQKAHVAGTYSYGWFNALLELEALSSTESNANSQEISISFAKVEREVGTSRTLVLKHPNRYIPHSLEDLADIPLELYFEKQPAKKVAIEVVNVKSYTLRAKLRTHADIDGVDLSAVREARIVARNPVFLIEELRKAFIRLGQKNGYGDEFNMQNKLSKNIEFVFGPPGTGKTTYLASNVILPLMESSQDFKVLVLTPTNKSADVLVRRLMECMGTDRSYMNWLIRFGSTNDTIIEESGVFRDKTFDIRAFQRNVTVVTIARFPYDYFLMKDGNRLALRRLKWDFIIIDEASMIPLANIVYALYKKTPQKFIIAGDPFQIEPITMVDTWKNENIFTMVRLNSFTRPMTVPYDYPIKFLTTQYRSIPEIGEVFSKFAYDGILEHHRETGSRRPLAIGGLLDIKPLNIIKFPVSKYESIYRPKRLQGKTPYQVYSALFAFEFVKFLARRIEGVNENDPYRIGVIAPYRAQADLIDKLMVSARFPNHVDVQVGTIHGFQGDECDLVIAVFNPPPKISGHKEMFLNKLNIVNVSISRARDYLIILMPDDETENIDNLALVKQLEKLCKGQSVWSEHFAPLVEEVMLGCQTYLEDNSFSTSHQLVNVYGKAEKRYEIRSEDNALDVQIHEET